MCRSPFTRAGGLREVGARRKISKMSGSIIGDFFSDLGKGLGKVFDGNVFEGVGGIVDGTLKGAFRTIGYAGKTLGELTDAIFEDGQISSDEIPDEDKPACILASAVGMLAKMAKADRCVNRNETQFLSTWLDGLELNDEIKQDYKIFANEQTKDASRTIYDHAELFAVATDANEDIAVDMYVNLWRMALADGEISAEEVVILREIPIVLGLDNGIFNTVCEHPEILSGGDPIPPAPQDQSIDACYLILGCSPDASNAEVKRCYKAQMSQYHPDAISGKNLAPGFIEFANLQSAKINAAYETIKSVRGMR